MGRKYDATYLERLQPLLAAPKAQGYEWLACAPGQFVVDIGCGLGQDAAELAKTGATVVGLDCDETLLIEANAKYSHAVRFEKRSAESTGLEAASVDKLRFDRVLQHIEDHEPILIEIQRVLRRHGTVQITDTDYFSLSYFLPDPELERKLIDILLMRLRGSRSLRLLPERLQQLGFGDIRLSVHQLLVYGFDNAEYLVAMDRILAEESHTHGLSDLEIAIWEEWKRSERCFLAVNVFVMQAVKKA
jgi:SAM-dependent methyltransferase